MSTRCGTKKKYKHYWHACVVDMLRQYPKLDEEKSIQAAIYSTAIKRALEDTAQLPDGDLRIKAIEMVYFKATHSASGAAYFLNESRRTISRWSSAFVYLVGRYAGFV